MVESFLKGGILLYAKEGIIRATKKAGLDEVSAGLIGGFGGGDNYNRMTKILQEQ